MKPQRRPDCIHFSSGPCAKRPGWSLAALGDAVIGRSHRSKPGKARLQEVIERSRRILGVPADYRIAIVPASDTGAVEMALWSLLGPRPVDLLAWESFGDAWVGDVLKQLKLPEARRLAAPYGQLPDLGAVDPAHDVVFTWNGTTSGVRVPDGDWIADGHEGLVICDATSSAFAMEMPWAKLDVVTWSWQKVLGGEAAHGMIVLSPRAVARLESYVPPWPLPKIFRMTAGGKLTEGLFEGDTINTPSMLAVEDAIDGLIWAESIGGLDGLLARTRRNFAAIERWVERTPWIDFLAERPETRSTTSVCLVFSDDWFRGLAPEAQAKVAKSVAALLEAEGAALDVGSYRDAPAGLRIWAGATVETADIEALLPWIDWAYGEVRSR
ncbi:MAG TPA: phosphoserine transaminase [Aliidongia sp.]|nr:phosphoserine transaminase [Aliidongia sp.]